MPYSLSVLLNQHRKDAKFPFFTQCRLHFTRGRINNGLQLEIISADCCHLLLLHGVPRCWHFLSKRSRRTCWLASRFDFFVCVCVFTMKVVKVCSFLILIIFYSHFLFFPHLYWRFIIYKLPKYKIGEVGSGVDYMYLDSSLGSWQMSKFMVNTSQGAVGSTLNQLYKDQAYKVRREPSFQSRFCDFVFCVHNKTHYAFHAVVTRPMPVSVGWIWALVFWGTETKRDFAKLPQLEVNICLYLYYFPLNETTQSPTKLLTLH